MVYGVVGLTCWLTGYIPLISTEIILAGIGLNSPLFHLIPLAFVGALCQTFAKIHIYFISHYFVYFLKFKSKRKLIRLKYQFKSREKVSYSLLFTSALIGLPPYYLLNILCGLLNTGLASFCLLGFMGMFIRFYCCLAFPKLIIDWMT